MWKLERFLIGFAFAVVVIVALLSLVSCVDRAPTGPVECTPTDSFPIVREATTLHCADTVGWVYVGVCVQ